MAADGSTTSRWWALGRGDIDATVAQVGFNIAQMIIPIFLLAPVGIPLTFSVGHLLPGYALGFLIGSAGLTGLAVRLGRREGRGDVTAHVYGNNVPAIIAYTLSIMVPVYLQTHDELRAWQIGAAAVIWTGVIKLLAAPFASVLRRLIPVPASMTVFGAAMYSYLALVLLQRIFDQPLVGIVALTIVAISVLANVPITSWRIPPFIVAWTVPLIVGLSIGYVHPVWQGISPGLPFVVSLEPLRAMVMALPYLSAIVPMAIYQVLQDIASVEGATAAGDNYDARQVVAWDGIGTLVCGAAGSVIAPVVYAMHPPLDSHYLYRCGHEWADNVYCAAISLAHFGGNDCLCVGWCGDGDVAARGSKISECGPSRICSADGRSCDGGGKLGVTGTQAFGHES